MTAPRNPNYMKGFVPFAIAAAVMSLCGGFTAAVPANIVADWGLDAASATALITLAMSLGMASLAPIMGKLADVYGRRSILLVSLFIYTVGQLMIGISPESLAFVLLSRFVVGVGSAGIAPTVMAYIMMEFPPEKMGKGFMIYMLVSTSMVIFGPTAGGIVMTYIGWRPVMYICAGLSALALVICMAKIEKTAATNKTLQGFDFVGAIFVLIFFSMVLSIPTFGQSEGWGSTTTLALMGVGAVSLIILVMVEKKAQSPILNGKFMARKQFVLPVIVLFLSQGLMQSCMTNVITFSILTTGSRTLAGLAVSIMYIGMALGTIVVGPQADKKEPRVVAAAALVFVAIGAAMQMMFTATSGLVLLGGSLFFIGLGLGGNATIFLKVALSGLDPALAGSGAGTYNVFRDMSAPFGVALFVPMFSSGYQNGMAAYMAEGMEQGAALVTAAVDSIKSTAMIQVACVIVGIVVCLMLPKIYAKKETPAA